jgi:uncharacterized membrane protein
MASPHFSHSIWARLLYAILLGLVGAGIVHIVVLLLLPTLGERDAWSRLAAVTDLYVVVPADGSDQSQPVVEAPDPQFLAIACRFDLEDGPVRVRGQGTVPFWSASIYDRSGQNVYNFNDRTAEAGALDFVVVTSAQMIEMRKELPADLASSVFVEADIDEGMLVVRSFVPDDSWTKTIATYLGSVSCTPQ